MWTPRVKVLEIRSLASRNPWQCTDIRKRSKRRWNSNGSNYNRWSYVVDSGDTVKADCFGKVIHMKHRSIKLTQMKEHLVNTASDPVPENPGNETPRQGIGNQNQGHPAGTRSIQFTIRFRRCWERSRKLLGPVFPLFFLFSIIENES